MVSVAVPDPEVVVAVVVSDSVDVVDDFRASERPSQKSFSNDDMFAAVLPVHPDVNVAALVQAASALPVGVGSAASTGRRRLAACDGEMTPLATASRTCHAAVQTLMFGEAAPVVAWNTEASAVSYSNCCVASGACSFR